MPSPQRRAKAPQPVPDRLHGHANLWYVDVADALIHDGAPVVSRGRAVHEALHTTLHLPEPRKRVLTAPYRRANPFFQAAETVWILAGRADAQWILPYNKQLSQFLDTAVPRPAYFHGAYGERLRRWGHISQLDRAETHVDQIRMILLQLQKDPGSRRAVATLHNPAVDNPWIDTLDRPCNIALSVQQRDGQLHMAVFNRSNDLTLGLAYTNIVQFTTIQEFLAAGLGLQVGTYSHFSSSLHLYDDDAIARRCTELRHGGLPRFDVYDHCVPTPMRPWASPYEGFDLMEMLAAKTPPTYPLDCPYWDSIRQLLQVWGWLHSGLQPDVAADAAAGVLTKLPAQDWGIAALEFLYRWACKRQVGVAVAARVQAAGYPPLVQNYIFHDGERADG